MTSHPLHRQVTSTSLPMTCRPTFLLKLLFFGTQTCKLLRTICQASCLSRWHLSVHPAKTVWMVLCSTGMPPCQLSYTSKSTTTTSHKLLDTGTSESPSMNDCPGRITPTMWSTSLQRTLDSSVALAGNCLQPLSEISMSSASGLVSNMAALSGLAPLPRMLHAKSDSTEVLPGWSPKQARQQTYLVSSFWLVQVCRALVLADVWPSKAYLGRHPRHLQQALSSWISPVKRRQSPRTSPPFIHVQRLNKSFFQRSPLFQEATTWNRFVAATASRNLPLACMGHFKFLSAI